MLSLNSKHVQHVKIYLACNYKVNLITRLEVIGNPRWLPPWVIVLTQDPMGKCSNAFFSETTNIIKAKLYMKYSLDGPLQTLRLLFRYEIQNGGYGRT